MSKRQDKESLKSDLLVTYYARFIGYLRLNTKVSISLGVAFVLLIGLIIGYFFYQQSQETKAQTLIADAQTYFRQDEYQKALTGDEQALTVGFVQIINKYSGTKAANLAHYYAAVCEYNLHHPQKALNYLNDFEPPEGILGVGPISFKGVILRDLKQYDQAAGQFIKAANWDKNESTTPYNLIEAANTYIQAKENSKALEAIQQVLNNYSNTPYVSEAQRLQGYLTANSVSPATSH